MSGENNEGNNTVHSTVGLIATQVYGTSRDLKEIKSDSELYYKMQAACCAPNR